MMDIYLSNAIVTDLQYTDADVATYAALKSLHINSRETQVVTYNMLAYELFGNKNCTRTMLDAIKVSFNKIVEYGLISVTEELSKTEFVVDMSKLYFNFKEDGTYYTVVKDNEIHTIMNLDNRMDKFKLLRYFIAVMSTVNKKYGVYYEQEYKNNFVTEMSQEYLCSLMGINYKSNFKLIQQYNDVLEEEKIMYIYRHDEMKRDKVTGQIKSFTNCYGRYEDKNWIIAFAVSQEKYHGVNEEIVQSDKANNKRRLAAKYNNLCFDFGRYTKQYTDKELIEIYNYVHHENDLIEKEIADSTGVNYIEGLEKKLRDEDIFDDIPCVVDYVNKKHNKKDVADSPHGLDVKSQNGESDVWGEPDPMDRDYSIEEILDMPIASEVSAPTEDQSQNGLIDIGAIFEEEHIAPTKMAVGSPYIPDFDDDEIWDLY